MHVPTRMRQKLMLNIIVMCLYTIEVPVLTVIDRPWRSADSGFQEDLICSRRILVAEVTHGLGGIEREGVLAEAVNCCIRFTRKKSTFFNTRWLRAILTQGPKNVGNFLMTVRENELSIRHRSWNVTDSIKSIFDLNIRGQVLDITVQRNVPRFCTGFICACFSQWG